MAGRKAISPIEQASAQLRKIASETPEGELVGNEEGLIRRLGVSRITLRQAARLIEHEGVLRVRRGSNGGYFAARPDARMVADKVCVYLHSLALDTRHTGNVANALWIETLRQAASTPDRDGARTLSATFAVRVSTLADACMISEVLQLERESRTAIFELINGGYIDLIFRVNVAFSRHISEGVQDRTGYSDPTFVRQWKKAKLTEFSAIAKGDPILAMMAALQTRKLWLSRLPAPSADAPA